MFLKPDIIVRQVKNDYLIVDQDEEDQNLSYIYQMSPAAAYLWETFCDKEFTQEMMHQTLCEAFEVDSDQAERDIQDMLRQWEAYGLLIR